MRNHGSTDCGKLLRRHMSPLLLVKSRGLRVMTNTLIRRWKASMNLSFEVAKTRAKVFGGIMILDLITLFLNFGERKRSKRKRVRSTR